MRADSATTLANAASRTASLSARISTLSSQQPGITFTAPIGTCNCPTVPTSPGVPPQRFSMVSTTSAAAAAASRRRCIGTVPACPANPVIDTKQRTLPAIDVTTPSGTASLSSTGPCSMCTSTKPSSVRGSRTALGIAAGSNPPATMACRIVIPSASTLSSTAGSNRPASARLPRSVDLKRTPSSSAKATIVNVYGSRTPCRGQIRAGQTVRSVAEARQLLRHGDDPGPQRLIHQLGQAEFRDSADLAQRYRAFVLDRVPDSLLERRDHRGAILAFDGEHERKAEPLRIGGIELLQSRELLGRAAATRSATQGVRSNTPASAATNWDGGSELSCCSEITRADRLSRTLAGAWRSSAGRHRCAGKPTHPRARERSRESAPGRPHGPAGRSGEHAILSTASWGNRVPRGLLRDTACRTRRGDNR